MTINLFQTPEYRQLMETYMSQTISYLFDKNQEFSIVCEVKYTSFNPELPQSLKETFNETVMFIISGYTFESSNLEDACFYFEAGFGEENFGSTVTLPLLAITQIFVGDNPIIITMQSLCLHLQSKKRDKVQQSLLWKLYSITLKTKNS